MNNRLVYHSSAFNTWLIEKQLAEAKLDYKFTRRKVYQHNTNKQVWLVFDIFTFNNEEEKTLAKLILGAKYNPVRG